MMRAFTPLLVGAFLMCPPVTGGGTPPAPPPVPVPVPQTSPQASLPVGKWRVEYANEVTEVCEVQNGGAATVVEPVRIAGGKAVVNGGSVVIVFEGGRVQRWTPVGKRFVVEHWFPGSQFPTANPGVLGIAERPQ
jgi:hypothetical protein